MNGQTTAQSQRNSDFRPLEAVIVEMMQHFQVPGVAVGVIHDSQKYARGFGVTNIDHPLAVDVRTLFQIGSITKTVTGTAAMRLVEMGLLDMDAPVRSYMPDLKLSSEEVTEQITMRHLLTHSAGWPGDYFDDMGPGDDALARIVSKMAKLPQLAPPGSLWAYNNAGFYLAGRIIEVLTGKTYEAAMKELVLDPLGMTQSFFFAEEAITYAVATGHLIQENTPVVSRSWAIPRAVHPSGGLISSLTDQLCYVRFHLSNGTSEDGNRVLTEQSIAQMRMPQQRDSVSPMTIGLTWWSREVGGVRIIEHDGATVGQQSKVIMIPEYNFALVILTNATTGKQLHDEVTQWALRHYFALSEPKQILLELSAEQLASYVGIYTNSFANWEVRLDDGQLVLTMEARSSRAITESTFLIHLAFCGKDHVIALDSAFKDVQGEFLRSADGQVKWLRFAGRLAVHK